MIIRHGSETGLKWKAIDGTRVYTLWLSRRSAPNQAELKRKELGGAEEFDQEQSEEHTVSHQQLENPLAVLFESQSEAQRFARHWHMKQFPSWGTNNADDWPTMTAEVVW
jgi:hypothetical protein